MDRIDNKEPLGLFAYESDDRVIGSGGVSLTLLTTLGKKGWWLEMEEPKEKERQLRIRKLTPYECGKLMGFDRNDFERMSEAGLAEATLYHSAGDSIVTTVLMGLFGKMAGLSDEAIASKISDTSDRIAKEKSCQAIQTRQ